MTKDTTRREFVQQTAALAGVAAAAGMVPAATAGEAAELAYLSAIELAAKIRAKEISALELTRFYIDRIERHDEKINAVVVRDFERALADAETADAELSAGKPRGPLHGVPMTIKESYDIAGLPTTWGIPEGKDNIAKADSVVVQRFKAAGAHFMGKTNVPINLGDYQSYNAIYGTTNNPWDLGRTPGGSSGGSAATLAAGMAGLESGSDIGGSIRNPAHYCGVFGHKPTHGIVPARGHQPPGVPVGPGGVDLAVVGPLARSAADLALAMDIVAGPDFLTAPGWRLELPPPRRTSFKGLRVALWADDPMAPVEAEVAARVTTLGEQLAGLGATVSDRARPEFSAKMSHETYLPLLTSVTGGPENELKHFDWQGLNGRRNYLRIQWQKFFQDWDVVVCPISATAAFPQDESDIENRTLTINGEQRPYFEQLFWAGLGIVSYLPSTVFPTGLSRSGLPIGLQAMGAEFDDRTTIEFARLVEEAFGGFTAPEGYA